MTTNDPERPTQVGSSPPPSTSKQAVPTAFLKKGNQHGNQNARDQGSAPYTNDTNTDSPAGSHSVDQPVRAPLARGRKYQFRGYRSGFTINAVAFRGHPEDDGGLQGVSVSWWGGLQRKRMWYPVKSEEEFWEMDIFKNAYDCPNASDQRHLPAKEGV